MSDMLSQEEINALLQGGVTEEAESSDSILSDEEKDALGEVGNISMGTASTTLFTLLNQKVSITTPRVKIINLEELFQSFDDPCVTVQVKYTLGLEGNNLMVLDSKDVKVITDLMLGGDGTNTEGDLNEMHLSAISEAMNQMIGSASTSLSEMMGEKIDISPPQAYYEAATDMNEETLGFSFSENLVMISFRMTVGDLVDSEIMQLMPIDMAKNLIKSVMPEDISVSVDVEPPSDVPKTSVIESEENYISVQPQSNNHAEQQYAQGGGQPNMTAQPMPNYGQSIAQKPAQPANVQSLEFQSFSQGLQGVYQNADISLIKNVPLEISVELGRTSKKISEILEFSSGSVIELDKIVGESLDILANGKPIAKGEVVVVDENYGIRITEIVVPEHRV